MRFNAPPNWPPVPPGWSPPPGWQPPREWPPVPPGWPLWVDDGAGFAPGRGGPSMKTLLIAGAAVLATVVVVVLVVVFAGGGGDSDDDVAVTFDSAGCPSPDGFERALSSYPEVARTQVAADEDCLLVVRISDEGMSDTQATASKLRSICQAAVSEAERRKYRASLSGVLLESDDTGEDMFYAERQGDGFSDCRPD